MPLFTYSCKACGESAEILVRGSEEPACPSCGSKKLDKQPSAFAAVASSDSGPAIPEGCRSCCSRQNGTCPNL